jgi:dienelactone hydrolase
MLSGGEVNVFPAEQRGELSRMLRADVQARREAVNRRDREAWAQVRSREDWERFAGPRIEALRRSLGAAPPVRNPLNVHIGRTLDGPGYRIENLVYESRPGIFVSANLYLPAPLREMMPSLLIVHSHHNPKTQGELQDMGMTWARQGCMVLVPDQPGYGERRDHRPGSRQDYRFRYIHAAQLHVLGDSLAGWMAWDTMRGIDLLLGRRGADPERVILIGSVAGGGDLAAVVAALDPRVTCVVPFNFGGPQPETRYPLPEDAETRFNYLGSAYWESTRNLRLSGRDGFLPWVIVGSVAPRRLIYAHEFSWDRERDPVWKRLQRIYGFYGARDHLAFAHGGGVLSGSPPEATHCNNVGAVHRKMIHPALDRWFGIPVPAEYQGRRPPEELTCFTPELVRKLKPRPAHELYTETAEARAAGARARLAGLKPAGQRKRLRDAWAKLLGEVEPDADPAAQAVKTGEKDGVRIERIALAVEPGVTVPLALLLPARKGSRPPVAIGICQEGKSRFLRERTADISQLLQAGVAVCLPDVRGTGETAPEGGRGYQSEATSLSAAEWMFGRTLLGLRLRDLRSVIRHLRTRRDVDAGRIALWGESFAPANPAGFTDPLIGEEEPPAQSEPLGSLLALFGALYEEKVRAVVCRGGLAGYGALLRDRYCYIPHDALVPGALTAGNLCDVAAALAPRPLRIEGLVDGRNVRLLLAEAQHLFEPTVRAYRRNPDRFLLSTTSDSETAAWLVATLRKL